MILKVDFQIKICSTKRELSWFFFLISKQFFSTIKKTKIVGFIILVFVWKLTYYQSVDVNNAPTILDCHFHQPLTSDSPPPITTSTTNHHRHQPHLWPSPSPTCDVQPLATIFIHRTYYHSLFSTTTYHYFNHHRSQSNYYWSHSNHHSDSPPLLSIIAFTFNNW